MPGEERKFKRRTIVAFVPLPRRECEEAASHALARLSAARVAVGATSGGIVGEDKGVGVGLGMFVSVGDGPKSVGMVCGVEVGKVGTAAGLALNAVAGLEENGVAINAGA